MSGGHSMLSYGLVRQVLREFAAQRIEALRDAGWNQFVIPITPGEERAIDDWVRIKKAFI